MPFPNFDSHSEKRSAVDIVILSPEDAQKQQMSSQQQTVRQADPPEDQISDMKEKARFKSAKEQRVLVETQAHAQGLTQNRQEQPRFIQENESRQKPSQKSSSKPLVLSQSGIDYSQFDKFEVQKEIQNVGPSTTGELLPKDVSVGSFTALNTDKFTYYTFFSRIEELVRFRWESKVKEAAASFNPGYFSKIVSQKNWVTQIEFLLKPNGELYQVRFVKESGIAKFDMAPVWAFKDARIFPNPPQELVEADGFIHLDYSFNVQLGSQFWAER